MYSAHMELKFIKLSKKLSYALRHNPAELGLEPDEKGFVPLEEICEKLGVTHDDIAEVLAQSPKRRFEIREDRIRALYGHSFDVDLGLPEYAGSPTLYHGTSRKAARRILEEGLKPAGRQYVHLSKEPDDAQLVGRRRDRIPVILKINVNRAKKARARLFDAGDVVLSTGILDSGPASSNALSTAF